MCTLVTLRRPGHDWPVLIAANRDERQDRPWRRPARHWPDRPEVIAGMDELAGGSWLGVNDHGVVAAILNRVGSLGPEPGKRSRGELVLEALDHADAADAAEALSALDGRAYRTFNMVIVDSRDAFWLRHTGQPAIECAPLPSGLSMLTAHDLDSPESARVRFHRPRFEAAAAPDPAAGRWSSWETLLASRESEPDSAPFGAMRVETDTGFGSVNASLIALPAPRPGAVRPLWRFAAGAPGRTPFEDVRA
ncbi:MAG: NRDE family protein [Alphaproteobacteria bacterium]|nr:NRDE family protein [Alphaproteobacteria bacterium]